MPRAGSYCQGRKGARSRVRKRVFLFSAKSSRLRRKRGTNMPARTMSRRSFMTKGAIASAAALAVGAGLAGCSGSGAQKVKPAILVVSFGTSFNDSRHITIGAIESAIREKFPDYDVRRANTSTDLKSSIYIFSKTSAMRSICRALILQKQPAFLQSAQSLHNLREKIKN